jgi:hypothetical protein
VLLELGLVVEPGVRDRRPGRGRQRPHQLLLLAAELSVRAVGDDEDSERFVVHEDRRSEE